MTLSAAERKRRQRERERLGSRTINLEITDWQTWVEILREKELLRGADSPGAVAAATTKFIFKLCCDHRHDTAEAQLAELRPAVTGIMKREEPASMEEWRLYAAKDKTLPVKVIKPKNVRPKLDPKVAGEIALG